MLYITAWHAISQHWGLHACGQIGASGVLLHAQQQPIAVPPAVTRQCALTQVMFMVCVGNARPELPQGMPPDFLQLLTDCWCAKIMDYGLGHAAGLPAAAHRLLVRISSCSPTAGA